MAEPRLKKLPDGYTREVVNILDTLKIGDNIQVLGSGSLRSGLYSADVDAFCRVQLQDLGLSPEQALHTAALQFQRNLRKLHKNKNIHFFDIKSGEILEWNLAPDSGFSYQEALDKLARMQADGVVSPEEAEDAKALLKKRPTEEDLVVMRNTFKFHKVRWTYKSVQAGQQELRNRKFLSLGGSFATGGRVKIDVCAWLGGNRFSEVSCIYMFLWGDKVLTEPVMDIEDSLKKDIRFYAHHGNPFKALKRQFALDLYKNDYKNVQKMIPILNSDLGRIYVLYSDIQTLLDLVSEYRPTKSMKAQIRFEIDQFRGRVSNIYESEHFFKIEDRVFELLNVAQETNSMTRFVNALQEMKQILMETLNKETKKKVKHLQ